MKTMSCKTLGGACDVELQANSFKEIAELIRNPESMKERMESKKKLFISLLSQ
ncbi:hypothetical protein [Microbulbifer sp. JMSA008]|uniref:hypothetical protein n=1 Tax=Microbulbifer sp. JMSA008 TaxID=3243373 RepID=UPI00403A79D8